MDTLDIIPDREEVSSLTKGQIRPNRLKKLREQVRLTQEEVAKLLDLHHTTVSKHESMSRVLSPKDVEAYARLYKVSSYELFLEPLSDVEGDVNAE